MRLEDVRVGMRVRVRSGPYAGRTGEVLNIHRDLVRDDVAVLLDGEWPWWAVRCKAEELEAEGTDTAGLEWVDAIERRAGDPLLPVTADGMMFIHPKDVLRLCRAVRELRQALADVLRHITVDDQGLNCEIDCCAGKDVLRARDVLERWGRGGE